MLGVYNFMIVILRLQICACAAVFLGKWITFLFSRFQTFFFFRFRKQIGFLQDKKLTFCYAAMILLY